MDIIASLRNLKVMYFGFAKTAIVIPPQCLRCIGWNFLLMAQCFALRTEVTDSYISERIGTPLWYLLLLGAFSSGVFSFLTVFTDPGILPPINVMETDEETGKAVDTVLKQQQQNGGGSASPYTYGEYEAQNPNSILEQVNQNVAHYDIGMQPFCKRCKHLRPPMTAHCWWSDVCISEMDHYCIILGVVVGARNLRWFMCYLLSVMLTSVLGMTVVFKSLELVFASAGKLLLFIGIICACLIAFLATSYFFTKGLRLIWNGQSTRGEIKGLSTSSAAVRGVPAIRHVLFPTIPSLLPNYFEEVAALERNVAPPSVHTMVNTVSNDLSDRVEINTNNSEKEPMLTGSSVTQHAAASTPAVPFTNVYNYTQHSSSQGQQQQQQQIYTYNPSAGSGSNGYSIGGANNIYQQ